MGLIVFIFGLIIGSFLNCVIWRLYKQESLSGRSYCPHCRKQITWYDNVPVFSFLLLRGRCRHCNKKISWQYPIVEFFTALLFLFAWQHFNLSEPQFLWLSKAWIMIAVMMIVFVYDLRWQLVSVTLTIGAVLTFATINIALGFAWWQVLLWGVVGAAFYLIQYLLTHKRGVGQGDIWLGLLIGVMFPSAEMLITVIFLAYIIGASVAIILIIFGKKKLGSKLPMGVFLSLAAIIVLFFGYNLSNWYLGQF